MTVDVNVCIIFAATNGYIDAYPEADAKRYEKEMLEFLSQRHKGVIEGLKKEKALKEEIKVALKAALDDFKAIFKPTEAK